MKNFSVLKGLRGHFQGRTGPEPATFSLHTQLFQVKSQGHQKQFRADICLASRQKSAEPKVIFE